MDDMAAMLYEVEMKFPVADMSVLEARLDSLGATVGGQRCEVDTYYAHPCRDFAQTDEALRIRREEMTNKLTYKGPKIDATTKTRREIELNLAAGDASARAWSELLDTLGFAPVGEVRKIRRKVTISWQGREVEGSLDQLERLGDFAELELMAEQAGIDSAKACIESLAEQLGLSHGERRSYLELLLALPEAT
jgi:adenylate cyclase class 2